jgi:hypothetical protein
MKKFCICPIEIAPFHNYTCIFSGYVPENCMTVEQKEMVKLAKKAVKSMEKRKNEDIEEWANKLANDVKDLTD